MFNIAVTIWYKRLYKEVMFYDAKGDVLRLKIIIKMYLIENKEVTLFVQLNW